MCNVTDVDGRAFIKAILAQVTGQKSLRDVYEDLRGQASAEELNVIVAFAGLIERQITRDPRSFVDAIHIFNNSYDWTGGVPNLRTGLGKVEIHHHSEWSEFFTSPSSKHLLIEDRVAMARAYLREVIVCSHGKPKMWKALGKAFPRLAPVLKIMETGAEFRSNAPP